MMPDEAIETSDTRDAEFCPTLPRTNGATFHACVHCGLPGYRDELVDRGNGLLCHACTKREFRRLLAVEGEYKKLLAATMQRKML